MLESLLFMGFILAGSFFAFVSIVIYIIGGFGKDKKVIKIAHLSLLLPLFFFGSIFFYYEVVIPYRNNSHMKNYANTYIYRHKGMKNELKLNLDGSYSCRCSIRVDIPYKGTWETGGIDGVINFYNQEGVLLQFGMPSLNHEDKKVISFSDHPDHKINFIEK